MVDRRRTAPPVHWLRSTPGYPSLAAIVRGKPVQLGETRGEVSVLVQNFIERSLENVARPLHARRRGTSTALDASAHRVLRGIRRHDTCPFEPPVPEAPAPALLAEGRRGACGPSKASEVGCLSPPALRRGRSSSADDRCVEGFVDQGATEEPQGPHLE
jgi:hypothetical protein